jgi:hypothetical protein
MGMDAPSQIKELRGGVQVVRRTSDSADLRRDCGKEQFLDGNYLRIDIEHLYSLSVFADSYGINQIPDTVYSIYRLQSKNHVIFMRIIHDLP